MSTLKLIDIPTSRRAFLSGGVALGVVSCAGGRQRRRPTRIGLADITVQRALQADYAGTLRQVREMGYDIFGFRLAAYAPTASELTPDAKARLVAAAGLEAGVVRLSPRGRDPVGELSQARDIGARVAAMTIAPPFLTGARMFETTRAAFDAWLPSLAALGEQARSRGLTLAYHNHWFDFVPLDGERPLDIMARTVPADLLSFEVDLAWCWAADVDPLVLLRRLGSRVVAMHWKDVDRTRGRTMPEHAVPIGSGAMNYPVLLPAVRAITAAPGYIEVDQPADELAAARQGIAIARQALA